MTETFNFSSNLKKAAYVLMGIGLLGLILGFALSHGHTSRIWANLLLNTYYINGICLSAVFFIAAHQLGYAGWHTLLRRVPEAMGTFIPVTGVFFLIILAGTWLHWHHLYHWTDASLTDPGSPNYDAVLDSKKWYLNLPFWSFRIVAYVILWSLLALYLRRLSVKEDQIGGLTNYTKLKYFSALFIVIFAITSSTGSWDLIMSIDAHWYSTLFGWYNFASYNVAGISTILLLVVFLKSQGYLQNVNENHIHDLGKYMFGFSVFWTYLYFAQFLLIWYGNIPEETVYFKQRWDNGWFKFLFFFNFAINFFLPFLVLMTRKAKRNYPTIVFTALMIVFGHYLDFYLMIMPGAVGAEEAGFGWQEISISLGFIGMFIFVVFSTLTKASLIPINNPYLKESLQHHI
jgi:hypothetical protein